jgi:hypothetical protein
VVFAANWRAAFARAVQRWRISKEDQQELRVEQEEERR